MKNGDILNWAFAVLAILMLFAMASFPVWAAPAPHKYYAGAMYIACTSLAVVVAFVVTGLFSLLASRKDPILGAILGIGMFIVVQLLVSALIFALVVFAARMNLSNKIGARLLEILVWGLAFVLIVVLIGSLNLAFFRKPKSRGKQGQPLRA